VNTTTMLVVLGSLAALAAGGWAWRKHAPRSFWYAIEFPIKAALVYLTWPPGRSRTVASRYRE
jgi:S-DNA-T family DNA segregation ATPase FtsK/SpoIIIE